MNPNVIIQIVVRNGERFLRPCLNAALAQTYPAIRIVVLDNASTDATAAILEREYPHVQCIRHATNLGMWPGHELLLKQSDAPYILALSIDVILDPLFVATAVAACETDQAIAAVQGKCYQFSIVDQPIATPTALPRTFIDTCGFAMNRARRVLNRGHGELETQRFANDCDIFGVEGAAPFFRRSALERCRVLGNLWDPDFFWYGDDLDMAWRMTYLGFRQRYVAQAVLWHDRSTTKGVASSIFDAVARIKIRQAIPLKKRQLDLVNVRCTIIKNDAMMNIVRDLPWIAIRECMILGYALLFEPRVLLGWIQFFRLLPRMLRRRFILNRMPHISARLMHHWFTSHV